mgnify:CR=1 FL=1
MKCLLNIAANAVTINIPLLCSITLFRRERAARFHFRREAPYNRTQLLSFGWAHPRYHAWWALTVNVVSPVVVLDFPWGRGLGTLGLTIGHYHLDAYLTPQPGWFLATPRRKVWGALGPTRVETSDGVWRKGRGWRYHEGSR